MMNEHKIVIEMVVGRALPSASRLQEVLDEINRDIRMDFARSDWYAEIVNMQIEKVATPAVHLSADDMDCDVVHVSSEKGVLHKDGLTEEEFSQEMKKLMNTLIIRSGENE